MTVSIGGQAAPGDQYGIDLFGGYYLQLFAGNTLIAQETNAFTPSAGTFADRTITVDSATLDPSLYGQSLAIFMASTFSNAVTDFDNVRLTVTTSVPEPVAIVWSVAVIAMTGSVFIYHRMKTRRRRNRLVKVTVSVS